jgi:Thaumarchaeal output domain 1
LRKVGLAGIAILIASIIASAVGYATGGFDWTPSDPGFIYSTALTLGFIASIAAGLFGAIKEGEEFLIIAGVACIVLALVNKLFINRLYSWGFLDVMWILAGILMILDRFHIRKIKKAKEKEQTPVNLLDRFDKLMSETGQAGSEKGVSLERELYDMKKMLWVRALDKPELAKTLRGRLYLSRVGREVVKRFVDQGLEIVEPDIETTRAATYPKLSDLESYSQTRLQVTLDELVGANVLRKELYERLIACPKCHESSRVFIRNKCSKCGSSKVHMNRLLEHQCGAIYEKDQYVVPTGLRCPKCEKPVEDESELKSVGITFHCESCESIFSEPTQSFYCRRCANEFDLKECELADAYSYRLNDEIRTEAREVLSVAAAADALEELGFEVKVPGLIKGKTGVDHQFTLTCTKEARVVAMDVATARLDSKVSMTDILPSYAKFMDVSVTTRLLLAVPGLDLQTKDFLKANQVSFIEGENLSQIVGETRQAFR